MCQKPVEGEKRIWRCGTTVGSAPTCRFLIQMPTYANGYKQAVLKADEPKGLWVRILPLALSVRRLITWMKFKFLTTQNLEKLER